MKSVKSLWGNRKGPIIKIHNEAKVRDTAGKGQVGLLFIDCKTCCLKSGQSKIAQVLSRGWRNNEQEVILIVEEADTTPAEVCADNAHDF